VLAVKRYDRQDAPDGHLAARVHQEDECQAAVVAETPDRVLSAIPAVYGDTA